MKTKPIKRRRILELTDQQKQASQEKKETLGKLATSVREMGKEALEQEAMSLGLMASVSGKYLSPFNSAFVRRQRITATQVGGFDQWRKAKRKVKKGAKAVSIWLPMQKEDKENPKPEGEDNTFTFFRLVNVFDIADTEEI